MVRRETGRQRGLLRDRVRVPSRVLGLLIVPAILVAAGSCGASTKTSTGPTPPKCQTSVALSTPLVAAAGGSAKLNVTAQRECAWTVSSAVGWISGLTPASGQGDAEVTFSVASNPDAVARQGDLIVNDQHVPVRQDAAACRYGIAPRSWSLGAGGGELEVKVTAVNGCTWSASSNTGWIRVKSGESGTRDGPVVVEADANSDDDGRTGSLTIAGETLEVAQGGSSPNAPPTPPPPPNITCTYGISPTSFSAPAAGASGATTLQTNDAACPWSVASDSTWLTPTTSAGTGNQSIGFVVAANTGGARTGRLEVAGQVLTVTQAAAGTPGPSCTFSINPTSLSAGAAGVTGSSVTVSTGTGCSWAASTATSWITITSGATGAGPGTVVFNVGTNSGPARSGSLTIAGVTFGVTQAAAGPACSVSISPTSQSMDVLGGSTTVAVSTTASCSWSATTAATWIAITAGTSGTGNGKVAMTIAPNVGGARTGTVTIGGQTFTVNQASALPGPGCTYSINPTSRTTDDDGANDQKIDVNTQSGCAWTAVSNAPWVTITEGLVDVGDGEVRYDVAANTGAARQTTLTVAGRTFTVNQDAAPCSYSINPTSQTFAAAGGSGTVAVSTQANCSWTAVSDVTWIVVTAGANGTGNGTVAFTVSANSGGSRKGTVRIAGRTFTVQQN
jgi:hypothetical protein